ncbi:MULTISPECIES: MarR family winged helix-turn-helix transcriptional regulator [unclassified Fusibacter]|uniref:MarR family winged helix-turn-helix transcriptional regulator n=1 Tax=unclassified Fusibacter TaxID=2624464 RepID=UPI0010106A9D|nr:MULTISPECIES: MarR family transcriptional regulator [unclassified Fusibacter]MCK8058477.1 MarR family transcriptional regulator [Fusibacter sp. A2]NPE22755.1 MarR family transcriptional regulator [Fusibacter sp. A1]RXV60313.1 MarR family transcriptional regulator [Fusibacter sp. A1]
MYKPSIGKYISAIYRQQSIVVNHLLHDFSFGSSHYLFLINIHTHEGINLKELGKLVMIDRANTTRAVKKLEADGLVIALADETDKRNRKLYLTDKGKQIMPNLRTKLSEVSTVLTKDMTDEEIKQLESLLIKLSGNVQDALKDIKEENAHGND